MMPYIRQYLRASAKSTRGAGVVAIFAGLMLKGIAPTTLGDGSTTRDYLFVEDAVAANLLTLEGGDREIYHVSSGQQMSLNDLFC